jgi:hypothetical protein
MSPRYISGLAQTDGSFFCSIILSAKHRFGLQTKNQLNYLFLLKNNNYFSTLNSLPELNP